MIPTFRDRKESWLFTRFLAWASHVPFTVPRGMYSGLWHAVHSALLRIRAHISPGSECNDWQLATKCPRLKKAILFVVMFPSWKQPHPMTGRCRGTRPRPLTPIRGNSAGSSSFRAPCGISLRAILLLPNLANFTPQQVLILRALPNEGPPHKSPPQQTRSVTQHKLVFAFYVCFCKEMDGKRWRIIMTIIT